MIYGYCRISTKTQNIERQHRNILATYPTAKLIYETYTGTKFEGRKEFNKMLKSAKEGIKTARDNGKQIGLEKGTKLTTKKSVEAKEKILKHSKTFNGLLNDTELIKLCNIYL